MKAWAKRVVMTPVGLREVQFCPEMRVNYPGQRCPYTVQVAEPGRPEHQEQAAKARREHIDYWHGQGATEALVAISEDVLVEAERIVRDGGR